MHPVRTLLESGAHLFAVIGKRPQRDGWQTTPDEPEAVRRWVETNGRVGLMPGSVGLAVVDVDIKPGDGGPPHRKPRASCR